MTKEEINIRPRFKRLKRLFHRRQDDDLPPSQEPNLPVGRSTADDVSKNERLPESVALAQKILDKAVDNLKKKLPPDIELRSKLVIKGSADLKSLSQNVTAELLKMITKEEIKESKEIVNFVLSWAQKILPFVQQGLSIANNIIPPPYNLIALAAVFVVQKVQMSGDVSGTVNTTLQNLSIAIESVVIVEYFPRQRVGVNIAAIYLTAAIMDCLGSLIDWITSPRLINLIKTSDIDLKLGIVNARVGLYTNALQIEHMLDQKQTEILEWIWLGREDIRAKDRDTVGKTCNWFFKSREYKNWIDQDSSALICTGKVLFNRLRENPELGILYFFFSLSNQQQKAMDVIRSLLRQLLEQLQIIPDAVRKAYADNKRGPMEFSSNRFTELLKSSISEFCKLYSSKVFILIDAYDEFLLNQPNQTEQRGEFREFLKKISKTGKISIFITSRDQCLPELKEISMSQVAMQCELTDVETYLDEQLKHQTMSFQWKENIKNKIKETNEKEIWLLLITVQINYVLFPDPKGDMSKVDARLNSLPATPEKAYNEIIDRMTPDDKNFVLRLLGWVMHAQRTLRMSELMDVLAEPIGPPSFDVSDEDRKFFAQGTVSRCGGLVRHDPDKDLVTCSHATVDSYLKTHEFQALLQKHNLSSLPSDLELCKTCLTYLRLPAFEKPCNMEDLDERLEKFKFGTYAAQFWAVHANQLSNRESELEEQILETLSSDGRREAIEQLRDQYYTQQKSLLHILIENRLCRIFMSPFTGKESIDRMCDSFYHYKLILSLSEQVFPKRAINVPDGKGQTPLHCAARIGERDVVEWLIARGADVAAKSNSGSTALHSAAGRGHANVVALLLRHMDVADVATKDKWQMTALHHAAFNGHRDAVALLLDRGADVAAKDEEGVTALHWAAWMGHKDVVALLLTKMGEANVAAKDHYQSTALHLAAEYGHRDAVAMLLGHMDRADIAAKSDSGWTALHWAAMTGHAAMVALLLGHMDGADVAAKNNSGRTALHYAAERGHADVVTLLLGHMDGRDVAAMDLYKKTALHYAAGEGHKDVVALLEEWERDQKGGREEE